MFYFTNEQIYEIERRLAVRAKKDTDFDSISNVNEHDLVAIIHNGHNMICRLDALPGRLITVEYNEANLPLEEDNHQAATAFSIAVLKDIFGIKSLDLFDERVPYDSYDYVTRADSDGILRAYMFTEAKEAGVWDEDKVEEVNYKTIINALSQVFDEFKENGRVYVLESYFENGKAKQAISDQDGKNIKQYYALKSEIPDVSGHDIVWLQEQLDALNVGKLDKFSLGAHNLPVWFDENKEPQVIDGLDVPNDIHSGKNIEADGGMAAGGMVDLDMVGGGQGTVTAVQIGSDTPIEPENGIVTLPAYPDNPYEVVAYDDLGNEQSEDLGRVPSAYGVKIIKGHINVEGLPEFSISINYLRGDLCKRTDGLGVARGYRFFENKAAGQWDASKVDQIDFGILAHPLNITQSRLMEILTFNNNEN